MARPNRWILALALASGFGGASAANLTSLVNLFIGTASGANGGSGGNAFPGMRTSYNEVSLVAV